MKNIVLFQIILKRLLSISPPLVRENFDVKYILIKLTRLFKTTDIKKRENTSKFERKKFKTKCLKIFSIKPKLLEIIPSELRIVTKLINKIIVKTF